LTECRERILKYRVWRPLAEKRGLEPWEKIVNFTKDEWFPWRMSFGRFKGRREVKAETLKRGREERAGRAATPQAAW
jgi:hypothetical protein